MCFALCAWVSCQLCLFSMILWIEDICKDIASEIGFEIVIWCGVLSNCICVQLLCVCIRSCMVGDVCVYFAYVRVFCVA